MRGRLAAAAALSVLAAASAPLALAKDQPLVSRSHSVTQTVTVKSVDKATRRVVFTTGGGETQTVKAPAEFRRFDELKPGDRISATYRVETEVMLSAPNAPLPPDATGVVAARAGKGDSPAAAAANYIVVTGAVVHIDMARHTLKLVSPQGGEVHTIEVTREDGIKAMSRLKVGDKITAYVTESLLLAVDPA
jgi:Ni/Co efflux regulator RcnB